MVPAALSPAEDGMCSQGQSASQRSRPDPPPFAEQTDCFGHPQAHPPPRAITRSVASRSISREGGIATPALRPRIASWPPSSQPNPQQLLLPPDPESDSDAKRLKHLLWLAGDSPCLFPTTADGVGCCLSVGSCRYRPPYLRAIHPKRWISELASLSNECWVRGHHSDRESFV